MLVRCLSPSPFPAFYQRLVWTGRPTSEASPSPRQSKEFWAAHGVSSGAKHTLLCSGEHINPLPERIGFKAGLPVMSLFHQTKPFPMPEIDFWAVKRNRFLIWPVCFGCKITLVSGFPQGLNYATCSQFTAKFTIWPDFLCGFNSSLFLCTR